MRFDKLYMTTALKDSRTSMTARELNIVDYLLSKRELVNFDATDFKAHYFLAQESGVDEDSSKTADRVAFEKQDLRLYTATVCAKTMLETIGVDTSTNGVMRYFKKLFSNLQKKATYEMMKDGKLVSLNVFDTLTYCSLTNTVTALFGRTYVKHTTYTLLEDDHYITYLASRFFNIKSKRARGLLLEMSRFADTGKIIISLERAKSALLLKKTTEPREVTRALKLAVAEVKETTGINFSIGDGDGFTVKNKKKQIETTSNFKKVVNYIGGYEINFSKFEKKVQKTEYEVKVEEEKKAIAKSKEVVVNVPVEEVAQEPVVEAEVKEVKKEVVRKPVVKHKKVTLDDRPMLYTPKKEEVTEDKEDDLLSFDSSLDNSLDDDFDSFLNDDYEREMPF